MTEVVCVLGVSVPVLELEDAAGDMCQAAADGNVELLRQVGGGTEQLGRWPGRLL